MVAGVRPQSKVRCAVVAGVMDAGVRPQSKVAGAQWLLGSGPKVKSQATVLWRQTRELRQSFESSARPEGCALFEERGRRKEEGEMFHVSLGFAAFTKALAD